MSMEKTELFVGDWFRTNAASYKTVKQPQETVILTLALLLITVPVSSGR